MITVQLSEKLIRKQARVLTDFLKKGGTSLKPNSALEVLSKCYNYPGWKVLLAELNNNHQNLDAEQPNDEKTSGALAFFAGIAKKWKNTAEKSPDPLYMSRYENEWSFASNDNDHWYKQEMEFDALMNKAQSEKMVWGDFFDWCENILEETNYKFLDIYSHTGLDLFQEEKYFSALAFYQAGVDIGRAIIGDKKGLLPWYNLENRPFLRCHHGLILCLLKTGQAKEACALMEEHLNWNPNDNLGVRALAGPAFMQIGQNTKARKHLKNGIDFPEAKYMLGLLEFQSGEYVKAVTMLRRAILDNVYIAEFIIGHPKPVDRYFPLYSNVHQAEWLHESFDESLHVQWEGNPEAVRFLSWLYHSSLSLEDRTKHTLYYEHLWKHKVGDPNRMEMHYDESFVNDESSESIVVKVFNRYERENWPWEEDAANQTPWRKGEEPDYAKNII